ncbi:AraC family transcriptional regulator [Butyrivibrio proteoclasticus]|uniref:AraC family transcriptional regulator n=1 Tax=Butyrivibrio proteoclasticus TaxID=43305 RepID=UPI0006850CE6|nr:AraC family transcriptional regulator [Butyrivibrio proteoclasticus]
MKKKQENMTMVFPENSIFTYLRSGKFIALSEDWKHDKLPLVFDYELIVVTEGTLYIKYMDEEFTVSRGEYLILPPSDSFREGIKKSFVAFYWIHFTVDMGAFPARIRQSDIASIKNAACFMLPQTGSVPRIEKVAVQMKQIQDLERNEYPAITLNAATTALLTELYGQLETREQIEADPLGRKQIYSDIADYVRRNITANIKISDIANEFGYSSKYLSNLFSRVRGITLKQFILEQKMETASFFLTDSDRSITDIALELGFSDVHNFSRTYKKITGFSPSTYRNTFTKRLLYHV